MDVRFAGRIRNGQQGQFIDRHAGLHRQYRGHIDFLHDHCEGIGGAQWWRAIVRNYHSDQIGAGALGLGRGPSENAIRADPCACREGRQLISQGLSSLRHIRVGGGGIDGERLQFIYRLGGDGREYGPHIEDGYGEGRCPIIGNWFLATLGQIEQTIAYQSISEFLSPLKMASFGPF